jgi:fatty acid CoA ligase FadD9
MPATPGAAVSAERFRAAVRREGVGPGKDIPHLTEALNRKYLSDLKAVGF